MQSKTDSVMEVVSNTALGFILSLITWQFVTIAYGIPMPMAENLQITSVFTVVSLLRSYSIRRIFNGRTIWQAIKDRFGRSEADMLWPSPQLSLDFTTPKQRALSARKRVQHLIIKRP